MLALDLIKGNVSRILYNRNLKQLSKLLNIRNYRCSSEEIDQYNEDGVICLRGVFTAEDVATAKQGIEANMANPSIHHDLLSNTDEHGNEAIYFNDYLQYDSIPEYWTYITSSAAKDIAGNLNCIILIITTF